MDGNPRISRISDFVDLHAASTPDASALVLGVTRYSYGDLRDAVDRLARGMLAAGICKGDRVAVLQAPCPDFLISFLAAASIGAIWVGLNPRYRLPELERAVRDAKPRLLIARASLGGRDYFDEISSLSRVPGLERVVMQGEDPGRFDQMDAFLAGGDEVTKDQLDLARESCGGRDPCLLVYTSGSTGEPKGALLHHEAIIGFSRAQNSLWPVHPLVTQNFLPINHIGCVVDISCPAIVAGGTIHFMEQFDPLEALRMIEQERLTTWGSIPSVFTLQVNLPEYPSIDLSSLQLIVWEGASIPEDLLDRLLVVGPPLATNYGMTETTSAITILAPTRDRACLLRSSGPAAPGVELRIADTNDRPVPDGTDGEIQTRSRWLIQGYWQKPEATAAVLTEDGWFRTGDVGRRHPDGHVQIVGRLKEMYKSGGYNVYPREIETIIEAHPAVAMAAVVSRTDPIWQEVGVAYVMPEPGRMRSPDEIETWCRDRLANYKVPKSFVITTDIPLLPIGKVDKVALTKRAQTNA